MRSWDLLCGGLAAAVILAGTAAARGSTITTNDKPVSEMSLEELVNVQVEVGTLGGSEFRKVPAAVTTITSRDIRESGARNLNELLEIYVPNMLYLRQNWEASDLGFRGVTGAEKLLLLVNGKVMNNFTHAGAISERDLVQLGDIAEIQVVRGPGSAVYGAGALIGVIDIRTFNGRSYEGSEITVRAGQVEEFYSAEFKSGFKLTDQAHLFLYGSISRLAGADRDAAPLILALNGETFDGTPIVAGEPYPVQLRKDRKGYRGLPPLKFHTELTAGDFSLWARYTRGGERLDLEQRWLIQWTNGFAYDDPANFFQHEIGYQQISAGADFKHVLNDQWELAYRATYGLHDFVRREFDGLLDANREDIYTARALATWTSSDRHSLTLGFEYVHGEFGMPALGHPGEPAISILWSGVNPQPDGVSGLMPRWSTDTYSVLAENRWDITPEWSLLADMRIDKNDYTEFMYSPRAALTYAPSRRDTLKLIVSQAVKANFAEMLKFQHDAGQGEGSTETLQTVELGYQRLMGDNFAIGGNGFFNHFDIIGWDEATDQTTPVGELDTVGIELELLYRTANFRAGLSHSYTKMVGFKDKSGNQFITAEPYGFGHDLNHWSTHITKLHFAYNPIQKLRFTGSLRIFWGWPGWEDFSDYETFLHQSFDPSGTADPGTFIRSGYNPYDKIQARLNLGATYEVTENVTAGVHGYNILGLIDGHLNDRLIMFSSSARRDAAAVAFTLSCRF